MTTPRPREQPGAAPRRARRAPRRGTPAWGPQRERRRAGRAPRDDRRRVRLTRDADEVAHGAARREERRVEATGLDRLASLGGRRRSTHGAVRRNVLNLPAQLGQPCRESLRGDIRAWEEDAVDGIDQLVVRRPLLEQCLGRGLADGHEVRLHAEGDQRLGGVGADRGDLEAGEGPGVQAVLLELLAHSADGVDAREADPLVASRNQTVHGPVHLLRRARRLDADGGHLNRDRAEAHQPIEEVVRAVLGPRHENSPPEERLDVKPRHAVALGDDFTHDDHAGARLLGVLDVGGDVVERGDDGALLHGGAAPRDDHRGLTGASRGDQRLGDRRRGVGAVRHHDGHAIASQRCPVDIGVRCTDDMHLAAASAREAQPCVGGYGHGRAHTRRDLEGDLGLAQGRRLHSEGSVEHGISSEEAHGPVTLARRFDHQLGATCVIKGKPLGIDSSREFGVRGHEATGDLDSVEVGDDALGRAQQLGSAQGQQLRVARSSRDEGDGAELLLGADCAHGKPSDRGRWVVCGWAGATTRSPPRVRALPDVVGRRGSGVRRPGRWRAPGLPRGRRGSAARS